MVLSNLNLKTAKGWKTIKFWIKVAKSRKKVWIERLEKTKWAKFLAFNSFDVVCA